MVWLTLSLCFKACFHSPYLLSLEVIMLREVRQSRLHFPSLIVPHGQVNSWRLKRGETREPCANKHQKFHLNQTNTWKHRILAHYPIIQSSNMLLQQRCVYPPRSCELFTLSIAVQDSRHMCATRRHSHIEDMNAWVWRWRHEVSVLLLSYCQQLSSQNMTLHISVEISTQQYTIYALQKWPRADFILEILTWPTGFSGGISWLASRFPLPSTPVGSGRVPLLPASKTRACSKLVSLPGPQNVGKTGSHRSKSAKDRMVWRIGRITLNQANEKTNTWHLTFLNFCARKCGEFPAALFRVYISFMS